MPVSPADYGKRSDEVLGRDFALRSRCSSIDQIDESSLLLTGNFLQGSMLRRLFGEEAVQKFDKGPICPEVVTRQLSSG